jgi:BirA family biotin operon repressor/biotin-[acetyl-CoA-carboxylase] ligase
MGLNINQTQFTYSTATSLQQQAPLPDGYDLPGFLGQLCERLEARYLQLRSGQREDLRIAYLQLLYRYQEEALYEADGGRFQGIITDVDKTGRLVIVENGRHRVFAFKEVSFVVE